MISYLSNILKLPSLYFTLMDNLKVQRKYMRTTLYRDVDESRKSSDSSLSEKDYIKINKYYGLAVPAVLGESFASLRANKLALNERKTLTYLGALTGLYDDFFDKTDFSHDHIIGLTEHKNVEVSTDHERLFLKFFNIAMESAKHPSQIRNFIHNVFNAQVASKKQVGKNISKEEIMSITQQKGGYSLLFYRGGMNIPMNEDEKTFLYKIGGLLQLENDIFDIYKDNVDSIRTLATIEIHMENLRNTYIKLTEEVIDAVLYSNFPIKNKQQFLRIISMVVCRGYVCLDMLQKNELKTDNKFQIEKYQRNELICDMEKPINFLKSVHYYSKTRF
ncbi:MAG: hypothetical protein C0598_00420 [Marinilabiliales bacterium]|nr:MAG: hypothetical protein C0598_00420 [Marinilabiliales bacterium]